MGLVAPVGPGRLVEEVTPLGTPNATSGMRKHARDAQGDVDGGCSVAAACLLGSCWTLCIKPVEKGLAGKPKKTELNLKQTNPDKPCIATIFF